MKILAGGIVKRGWTVVSGMVLGIDANVHQAALEQGGKTIAVLGLEWMRFIPSKTSALYEKIVETGAVISEMLPGTPLYPGLFPIRNRIISGLNLGTIVVEAAKKSGSLITADYSMEQGREVFAVPGITSEQSQGTLRLTGSKVYNGRRFLKNCRIILFPLRLSGKRKMGRVRTRNMEFVLG